MKGSRGIIVATLAAVALLLVLRSALPPDGSVRGLEFFPDMARTPAVKANVRSVELPAGVALVGSEVFDFAKGLDEQARAGRELTNPYRADDAGALARGERLFMIYCMTCHGPDGETPPPVVLRGMQAPPSMKAAHALKLTDGEMFHILTTGQNNMASYAAQLPPDDRWKVILRVRALQREVKK